MIKLLAPVAQDDLTLSGFFNAILFPLKHVAGGGMANRRIEVHQYREVLYRVRQGQSLRAIDLAKLMERYKAQRLVSITQPLG